MCTPAERCGLFGTSDIDAIADAAAIASVRLGNAAPRPCLNTKLDSSSHGGVAAKLLAAAMVKKSTLRIHCSACSSTFVTKRRAYTGKKQATHAMQEDGPSTASATQPAGKHYVNFEVSFSI